MSQAWSELISKLNKHVIYLLGQKDSERDTSNLDELEVLEDNIEILIKTVMGYEDEINSDPYPDHSA